MARLDMDGRLAMRIPKLLLILLVGMASAVLFGCEEEEEEDATSSFNACTDGGVVYCSESGPVGVRLCVLSNEGNFWEPPELCAEGEVCVTPDSEGEEQLDARCVSGGTGGTGGTAGSGGTGGTGGTAGSGGTAGTGGTAGSGGTAGTGGTGGGASSCAELDSPGRPQLAGTLETFPSIVTFDECLNVRASVDADTREVTAFITNVNSGFLGGSGFALTAGDETVEICVRVETVADPGPHVLELELFANPLNRLNRVLYTPGDGDTYVTIEYENDVPGPETATTCLEKNFTVEFP